MTMPYANRYREVVWTNHALDRMSGRRLPQEMAYQALRFPDNFGPGKQNGTTEFTKQFNQYQVTVIATKNDQSAWVVVSCWVDPPFEGSIDIKKQDQWQKRKEQTKAYYKKYNKASFWGKFFLEMRRQLFGR